jgi:hypothetical protein
MSPVVVPSWRDLVPTGRFIRRLYSRPLDSQLRYVLFVTTRDGVVPIDSQLRDEAQDEASVIRAFAESHIGVLSSRQLAQRLNAELDRCREE